MRAAKRRPRPRRIGAATALVTQRIDTIGAMSCNPAIGGLGKGHLVREIDALDGVMARAADAAGIQFRVLNRRKGPAVQGPRAQADRKLYRAGHAGPAAGNTEPDLDRSRGRALSCRGTAGSEVHRSGGRTRDRLRRRSSLPPAPSCAGSSISAKCARRLAGVGDAPVRRPGAMLDAAGFSLGRLKTGTPPRLDGASIDWAALEVQPGDDPPEPFSSLTETDHRRRKSPATSLARPPPATPSFAPTPIVRPSIPARSPDAGRAIAPPSRTRSCDSPTATVHQIFLEPEGLDDPTIYPNGISTSLPADVQRGSCTPFPVSSAPACSGPAMRSNMTMSTRDSSTSLWRRSAFEACSSPGRSTARPGTKRPRRRAWSPA